MKGSAYNSNIEVQDLRRELQSLKQELRNIRQPNFSQQYYSLIITIKIDLHIMRHNRIIHMVTIINNHIKTHIIIPKEVTLSINRIVL